MQNRQFHTAERSVERTERPSPHRCVHLFLSQSICAVAGRTQLTHRFGSFFGIPVSPRSSKTGSVSSLKTSSTDWSRFSRLPPPRRTRNSHPTKSISLRNAPKRSQPKRLLGHPPLRTPFPRFLHRIRLEPRRIFLPRRPPAVLRRLPRRRSGKGVARRRRGLPRGRSQNVEYKFRREMMRRRRKKRP